MQSAKDLDQLRKQTGRVNQSEYAALTAPKNDVRKKVGGDVKQFGRVNVAEYKALTRKKTQRKRVAGK